MYELKNDKEFSALVYPSDKSDFDALEENIFDNGCKEPITVWNDIIIDGRKRYEICQKWELPFRVNRLNFNNRYEAIGWICKNQLQRNDLPDEARKYIIGKYYEASKDAYLASHDFSNSTGRPRGYQYKIAEEIGREFNLVSGTIYKYGIYTRAIDNISEKNRNLAEKILSGSLKVSQANIVELSRLPKEELRVLNNSLSESNLNHISYAEIRDELHWQHISTSITNNKGDKGIRMPIKELPEYDPDAEISSLSLTIPSWISSIERTLSLADLDKTTAPARERLLNELFALHKAVFTIKKIIDEVDEKNE